MTPYEKTVNLYPRFAEKPNIGKYDTSTLYLPTLGLVKPEAWIFTEKIDGTNIRIVLSWKDADLAIRIEGRKANSQVPGDLIATILVMTNNRRKKLLEQMPQDPDSGITLYGEGYGPGIQQHGGAYRTDKGFVLFDVAKWSSGPAKYDQYYLPRTHVEMFGEECGLTVAPRVFPGLGLGQVTKRVREGFPSSLAPFKGGERQAEGIIGSAEGLYHFSDGAVRRLKFKLKTQDFPS